MSACIIALVGASQRCRHCNQFASSHHRKAHGWGVHMRLIMPVHDVPLSAAAARRAPRPLLRRRPKQQAWLRRWMLRSSVRRQRSGAIRTMQWPRRERATWHARRQGARGGDGRACGARSGNEVTCCGAVAAARLPTRFGAFPPALSMPICLSRCVSCITGQQQSKLEVMRE